ncbi:MAG: hypothetical protein GWN00_25525, partial [Aliifodinibius sp.]|nr:hypothetical protein [Fodinibius sp.]NIV14211.1 hypothetical protein [Fodinibius sp.]NIY28039.1 hypothetical protein [Fodinibius sp.]
VAISSKASGKLYRYRWNGRNWLDDVVSVPIHEHTLNYSMTGELNYILTTYNAYDNGSSSGTFVRLFYLDELNSWQLKSRQFANDIIPVDTWYPGNQFAVARAGVFNTHFVFRWDKSFNILNFYVMG